jgi:enoyl-CoA hydratase/carnithine racemase
MSGTTHQEGGSVKMRRRDGMAKPWDFWIGNDRWDRPFAVIDLDAVDTWPEEFCLPFCPVIGVGSVGSPGAATVDLVIEPPATLSGVLTQVGANPQAAATVVQLLRIVPALPVADALTAESFGYAMLQGSAEHLAWRTARTSGSAWPNQPGRVRVERQGALLDIVLDRPGQDNAIDRTMRDALGDAFQLAAIDPSIEQVILRAEGKTFSLGADLDEFGTTTDPATAHAIRGATLPARMAALISGKLEARVQGACVGAGLEIAAFARRIVASPSAWFQLPELAMGVLPGAGGCVSVSRRIGRQRAALLILSGKRLSARRALDWGLIDAIVDDPA